MRPYVLRSSWSPLPGGDNKRSLSLDEPPPRLLMDVVLPAGSSGAWSPRRVSRRHAFVAACAAGRLTSDGGSTDLEQERATPGLSIAAIWSVEGKRMFSPGQ